jgi:uncharacterized protein YggE
MTPTIRLPALLVLALVATGCVPVGDDGSDAPVWTRGPVIEAQGRAYVEALPNRASFSVSFERRAKTSEEASEAVVSRARDAAEAVRLASEDEVRITSNLSVRPYYSQVTRRFGEHNEQLVENVHPDALLGYVATVSMNVVVLEPERAALARGAALAAGPVNAGNLGFYLEPTADDQRKVFAAAVRDAAARAQLIADETNATLGALQVLREGSEPCLGQPSTPPAFESRARGAMVAAPAADMAESTPAERYAKAAEDFALAADLAPQRLEARVCALYSVR